MDATNPLKHETPATPPDYNDEAVIEAMSPEDFEDAELAFFDEDEPDDSPTDLAEATYPEMVDEPGSAGGAERLQKLIAKAGIASRRAAEDLIAAGKVSVNGHVVKEAGVK